MLHNPHLTCIQNLWGFPDGSAGKEFACSTGDTNSIPGLGRSPGGRDGNPLQYSCLKNPMERGTQQATVGRVTKSQSGLRNKTQIHTEKIFT